MSQYRLIVEWSGYIHGINRQEHMQLIDIF